MSYNFQNLGMPGDTVKEILKGTIIGTKVTDIKDEGAVSDVNIPTEKAVLDKINSRQENNHVGEKYAGSVDGEIFNDYPQSHGDSSNKASGKYSHAEGWNNTAFGDFTHAQGSNNAANGHYSFTGGYKNIANGTYQWVCGKWNIPNQSDILIVGIGKNESNRKNGFTVDQNGNGTFIESCKAKNFVNTNNNENLFIEGKINPSLLPSYVDDVLEGYFYLNVFYKNQTHTTVIPAESGKIQVDLLTNDVYRYSGTTYIKITDVVVISDQITNTDNSQAAGVKAVWDVTNGLSNEINTLTLNKEDKVNKVNILDGNSTDIQYPSAKAVYDTVAPAFESFNEAISELQDGFDGKEDMENKVTSISSESTDTKYPSAKAVYDYATQTLDYPSVFLLDNGIYKVKNGVEYGSGSGPLFQSYVSCSYGILIVGDAPSGVAGGCCSFTIIPVPSGYSGLNRNIVYGYCTKQTNINAETGKGVDTYSGVAYELESSKNKITDISSTSTDFKYPSAKAVYDKLILKEDLTNKTTALSGVSTDTQYPSAKAVFDNLTLKENLSNKTTSLSSASTDEEYPSARATQNSLNTQNIFKSIFSLPGAQVTIGTVPAGIWYIPSTQKITINYNCQDITSNIKTISGYVTEGVLQVIKMTNIKSTNFIFLGDTSSLNITETDGTIRKSIGVLKGEIKLDEDGVTSFVKIYSDLSSGAINEFNLNSMKILKDGDLATSPTGVYFNSNLQYKTTDSVTNEITTHTIQNRGLLILYRNAAPLNNIVHWSQIPLPNNNTDSINIISGYGLNDEESVVTCSETINNKSLTIDENSTDEEYPSAKAVFDNLTSKENIGNKVTEVGAGAFTNEQQMSAALSFSLLSALSTRIDNDMELKEDKTNKTIVLSGNPTDEQYPSMKLFVDTLNNMMGPVNEAITELSDGIENKQDKIVDVNDTSVNKEVVKAVKQTNGKISVERGTLMVSDIQNLQNLLNDKQDIIASKTYEPYGKITEEIEKLDVLDVEETGKFVSSVNEVDGKINVTKREVISSDIPTLEISKINGLQTEINNKADKTYRYFLVFKNGDGFTSSVTGNEVEVKFKLVLASYDTELKKLVPYYSGLPEYFNDEIEDAANMKLGLDKSRIYFYTNTTAVSHDQFCCNNRNENINWGDPFQTILLSFYQEDKIVIESSHAFTATDELEAARAVETINNYGFTNIVINFPVVDDCITPNVINQ